jgi:hypothetical protein
VQFTGNPFSFRVEISQYEKFLCPACFVLDGHAEREATEIAGLAAAPIRQFYIWHNFCFMFSKIAF